MNAILDRRNWFGLITVLGLLAFEIFNYATNQDAMAKIFGEAKFFTIPIYYLLAIAFSAIDLGGLSSTFTEEDWGHEPWWVYVATGGWLIASIVNALLTYLAILVGMALAPISQLAVVMPKVAAVYDYLPAALTIVIWLIRVMLIGSIVASTNGGRPKKKPIQRPVQQAAAPTASQAYRPMSPAPAKPQVSMHQVPVRLSGTQSSSSPGGRPSGNNQADDDDILKLIGK